MRCNSRPFILLFGTKDNSVCEVPGVSTVRLKAVILRHCILSMLANFLLFTLTIRTINTTCSVCSIVNQLSPVTHPYPQGSQHGDNQDISSHMSSVFSSRPIFTNQCSHGSQSRDYQEKVLSHKFRMLNSKQIVTHNTLRIDSYRNESMLDSAGV